jgi:phosphoribosylamine--glycine ligase
MRVLVVGKGGREHALAHKISGSPLLTQLWVAPGNPGMTAAGLECVAVESTPEILKFATDNKIELVVLGPEGAILSDLKESLVKLGIACFAPDKAVARLEASKIFCKEILQKAEVPTAAFEIAFNWEQAQDYLLQHDFANPIVIKADGLAAGKGVSVCKTKDKALTAAEELSLAYGFPLLFEECLTGPELSAFAMCDGEDFVMLGTACDYKRITPDLFSANTGGMGAYSPCDFISADEEAEISKYFAQTLATLKKQKMPYQGFLFMGLMKTPQGLSVLEYNVRMGDPETQALMPRLRSDLLAVISKSVRHELGNMKLEHHPLASVHVVVASEGYPNARMNLGNTIQAPASSSRGEVYYAGVGLKDGKLVNTGGRVLGVTSLGETRKQAREKAYQIIKEIKFTGQYYRQDIAE